MHALMYRKQTQYAEVPSKLGNLEVIRTKYIPDMYSVGILRAVYVPVIYALSTITSYR